MTGYTDATIAISNLLIIIILDVEEMFPKNSVPQLV